MYTRWSYYPHTAHTQAYAGLFIPINSHDTAETLNLPVFLNTVNCLIISIVLKPHYHIVSGDSALLQGV